MLTRTGQPLRGLSQQEALSVQAAPASLTQSLGAASLPSPLQVAARGTS